MTIEKAIGYVAIPMSDGVDIYPANSWDHQNGAAVEPQRVREQACVPNKCDACPLMRTISALHAELRNALDYAAMLRKQYEPAVRR